MKPVKLRKPSLAAQKLKEHGEEAYQTIKSDLERQTSAESLVNSLARPQWDTLTVDKTVKRMRMSDFAEQRDSTTFVEKFKSPQSKSHCTSDKDLLNQLAKFSKVSEVVVLKDGKQHNAPTLKLGNPRASLRNSTGKSRRYARRR